MNRIEELEQLKKEYQEIPIPEKGVLGVQMAMERANQKKRLKARAMRYVATVAAAAFLLLIMPQGVFALISMSAKGGANMAPDAVSKGERYEAATDGRYGNTGLIPGKQEMPEEVMSPETSDNVSAMESDTQVKYEVLLQDAEVRMRISKEIRRQIDEAVLQGNECFTEEKRLTEGFVCIFAEQEYYVNKEGQLVIVFAPGEIAPREYGNVEFVIPDEVIVQ